MRKISGCWVCISVLEKCFLLLAQWQNVCWKCYRKYWMSVVREIRDCMNKCKAGPGFLTSFNANYCYQKSYQPSAICTKHPALIPSQIFKTSWAWKHVFIYRMRPIISRGLHIFTPFMKTSSLFSRSFFQKILSLYMANIQELVMMAHVR